MPWQTQCVTSTGDTRSSWRPPDTEYSGAGAALGALHLITPIIRRVDLPNVATDDTWSVSGAPALCVMFARLGAFGGPFDLVISGVNPGANVGRAVYHSGTVGAALTARNGKISGVAFSQAVTGYGVEGQAWDDAVRGMSFEASADVARAYVQAFVDDMPTEPVVVNINVPDRPISENSGLATHRRRGAATKDSHRRKARTRRGR